MRLEITIEGQKPYLIEVPEQSFTIGRSEKNIVCVPSESISRSHISVRVDQGKIFVTDLGSTNGTFINGEQLPPHQEFLWQTFFSINLSNQISIALSEEQLGPREIAIPTKITSQSRKDEQNDFTKRISINKKKKFSDQSSKKKIPFKKNLLSLLIAMMVLFFGAYFQLQMNEAKDKGRINNQDQKKKSLNQKSVAKNQILKITSLLEDKKCLSDIEKELCISLKTKLEMGEGVILKDKRLYVFFNFTNRLRQVELDPSFSFANELDQKLYLMSFMLFRPDLRNILLSNGAESLTINDVSAKPLKINRIVSITTTNLSKLTMIDVETIFSSLIHKQDSAFFKSLVIPAIEDSY